MGKGWILVLALVVVSFSSGVLDSGFVLDAERVVRDNTVVDDGSFSDIVNSHWWSSSSEVKATLYRPVPLLWFSLMAKMGDGRTDAKAFHVGSLCLHLLVALARFYLVLCLLKGVSSRFIMAFLAAGIPAIHAISMESVACIVGSAEMLAALFMTLSWLGFAHGLNKKGPADGAFLLLLSAFLWLLALLSKETSIFFPVVLLMHFFLLRPTNEDSARRSTVIATAVLFVVAAGGWWFLRGSVLGTDTIDFSSGPYSEFTTGQRIASALATLGTHYVPKLFLPFGLMPNLTHQDTPPPNSFFEFGVIVGAAALALFLALFVLAIKKSKRAAVFLLFAGLVFLPVSNLVVGIGTVGGFRLLYSPLFGLIAAFLVFLADQNLKPTTRKIAYLLIGLVAGLGGAGSFSVASAWQSPRSLAHYAYDLNEKSVWALSNKLASDHTSGEGPNNFEKFVADFDALDRIEDKLATLPGSDRLDHDSRVIVHRLHMQRSSALGVYATTLKDAGAANDAVQAGVRAAQKAEMTGWGDKNLVFDSRLAAFRLRLVALDAAMRVKDQEEMKAISTELDQDLIILNQLETDEVTRERRLSFLFEASRFAQMRQKPDQVDYYLARGMAVDPTHPRLVTMKALQLRQAGNLQEAYVALQPVIEAKTGGIEEHFLMADILRGLRKPKERLEVLQKTRFMKPKNENEVQLLIKIGQMLGGK